MKTDIIELVNQDVTLTTYLLDSPEDMPNMTTRPAVLVFPGGGYQHLSNREAEPIAMAFLAEGYHAFVLRYSVSENAEFPKPLNDAEEALELIRSNAIEWGVKPDQIVACGFSAGGHLAVALGTMGRIRPDALILGYACILESISATLPFPIPSLEKEVDRLTPPAFIFSTANDARVPVRNSIQFAASLDEAGIPFDLHIYQDGPHGLSLAKAHTAVGKDSLINPIFAGWLNLCLTWLENLFGEEL